MCPVLICVSQALVTSSVTSIRVTGTRGTPRELSTSYPARRAQVRHNTSSSSHAFWGPWRGSSQSCFYSWWLGYYQCSVFNEWMNECRQWTSEGINVATPSLRLLTTMSTWAQGDLESQNRSVWKAWRLGIYFREYKQREKSFHNDVSCWNPRFCCILVSILQHLRKVDEDHAFLFAGPLG